MHGAALVRIPNPFATSEATSSRPFCVCATDSASRSRPVALASWHAGEGWGSSAGIVEDAKYSVGHLSFDNLHYCHPGRAHLRDPVPSAASESLGPGSTLRFGRDDKRT